MKVVLVRPNYDSTAITPYLGIGYLSSYMKSKGIEVIIIDNLLHKYPKDVLLKKIIDLNPDCVGITSLSSFFDKAKELCFDLKKLKEWQGKIVIGGVHATFLPYSTLKETGCDFVICGEGEIAFSQLVLSNFNNDGIKGVYKTGDIDSDDNVEFAELVENLDDIPFPDWEQMNPSMYTIKSLAALSKKSPLAILMSSRGCYGHCTFCANPWIYKKVRFRSPENVIAELKYLKEKFKIKEVHFLDDNLIAHHDYATKLFNLMIKEKLNLVWNCPNGVRGDSLTLELAKLMKKAGCYQVAIGIESANNQILKNIAKGETIDQIHQGIKILRKARIETKGNFILGLPGETKETLKETVDFAIKSKLDKAGFYMLDILPGCALWRRLKHQVRLSDSNSSWVIPNWIPEGLTRKDLEEALSIAYKRFYLRPRIMLNMLRDIKISQYKFLLHRLANIGIFKFKKKTK